MIRFELEKLLNERSLYWLSQETNIRWGTLAAMAKGKLQRLDLDSLDRICQALECQPGDVLIRLEPRRKGRKS